MFPFRHEQADTRIPNPAACSPERVCESCITHSALKVFHLIVSSLRHLQLCSEVTLMEIKAVIHLGIERLGPLFKHPPLLTNLARM